MPRVNPITIPVPADGDTQGAYSLRMMGSHFGDQPPQGGFGGGGGGSGTVTGRWFQAKDPVSFQDALAGGLCDRSGLYFPGHAMRTNRAGDRMGDLFFRDDPDIDEWSDEPWQP